MKYYDPDDLTVVTPPKRRLGLGCVGWILLVLVLAAGAAFGRFYFMPMRARMADLASRHMEASNGLKALETRLEQAQQAQSKLETERDALSNERQKAIEDKERALKELEDLKGELSSNLEAELKSGDIGITRRGRDLVLDVSDKVLFDVGKIEINERGKTVLKHVAQALNKLTNRIVQVGGHTDNTPVVSKDVKEHFPTNWELSAMRATNVVRYLQDTAKIPGDRLMAAGFAQYRPVANNANEAGRQKNRRIEIVLLPREPAAP